MEQLTFWDRPKFKINKPIRLIELFAGIGSQAKALENLGADFEHWKVCEFDKYAIASYNAIHGTDFEPSDITQLKGEDLEIVDTDNYIYLLTYSFPCQDLSNAGKQRGMVKGSGTRSGLLWEVERLLQETENLPQVLLMENVPQVHGQKNMYDFNQWIQFLESKGYLNFWQDLNAKNYGIPQNRDRCFMVSILGNYDYNFPKPVPLTLYLKDMLEDNVDKKYYLSDEDIKDVQLSDTYSQKINAKKYLLDNIGENVIINSKEKIGIYGIVLEMSEQFGKYNILKEQVASTLKAAHHDSGVVDLPSYVTRKLTPREYWRLMGFTDKDYDSASIINSDYQLYKQAGNSIVVNVLETIFKQML